MNRHSKNSYTLMIAYAITMTCISFGMVRKSQKNRNGRILETFKNKIGDTDE